MCPQLAEGWAKVEKSRVGENEVETARQPGPGGGVGGGVFPAEGTACAMAQREARAGKSGSLRSQPTQTVCWRVAVSGLRSRVQTKFIRR